MTTAKTDHEHYQHHQALKAKNPHAAALYLNDHGDAVFRVSATVRDSRVTVVREAAAKTGKTVDQLLEALGPAWSLAPSDVAEIKRLAGAPRSVSSAQALIAKQAERKATVLSVQSTMQADAAALGAFRDYEALKASNPHAAALRLNEDSDAIFRGRELAEATASEPEPPQAA